jgi:phosphoribosylformylglycinamidine cyclo-ligase
MGLGMVIAVEASDAEKTIAALEAAGEKAWNVGEIVAGEKGVDLC